MVCARVHVCACTCMCAVCVSVWWRLLCWEWKGQTWFLWSHLRDVGILLTPSPLRLESFKETGSTQDPHMEKSATMHCWHTAVSRLRNGVWGIEPCVSSLPRKDPIGLRYNTEWLICPRPTQSHLLHEASDPWNVATVIENWFLHFISF